MMHKEWLRKAIMTSIIILFPIAVGIYFWDELPQTMVTHWSANGTPDGFSSKAFAVFVPTLVIFAAHWICAVSMLLFSNYKKQSPKAVGFVLWIMPAVSVFCNAMMYAAAFGAEWNISVIAPVLFGLLFAVIGNYLPKVRQNAVFGIKLPWTLKNEENWNKTHRLAGKVWMVGGALQMLAAFVPKYAFAIFLVVLVLLVLIPTVYSYCLYRKTRA